VQGMWERIKEARQKPEVPESLCCSITFELMKDPVIVRGPRILPHRKIFSSCIYPVNIWKCFRPRLTRAREYQ
jgi:hypothetical protein